MASQSPERPLSLRTIDIPVPRQAHLATGVDLHDVAEDHGVQRRHKRDETPPTEGNLLNQRHDIERYIFLPMTE